MPYLFFYMDIIYGVGNWSGEMEWDKDIWRREGQISLIP